MIKDQPLYSEGYLWLGRHYMKQRQYDKGIAIVNRLLEYKPEDQAAKSQLEQLRALAGAESLKTAVKAETDSFTTATQDSASQ
jgi:tetratricopeptide (TPR) repeat protein